MSNASIYGEALNHRIVNSMTAFTNPRRSPALTWISFPRPNPAAAVRLFCFPYAGGGSNIYYKWASQLPDQVELCLVHLPGREQRLKETPFDHLPQLVQALERPLLPYLDRPAAFWGHSMGGLICFELARQFRRAYGLQPAQLFISASGAPQRMRWPASVLDRQPLQFLHEVQSLNQSTCLTPEKAMLVPLMLPALKADLTLCATYCYETESPLDCAITAFGGLDDQQVKREYLEAWQEETTGRFALHLFDGDHFFIHSAESKVLKALSEELRRLAPTV
jgi:medium-chain acyl-[acyl-carrier-protein] hydrolase